MEGKVRRGEGVRNRSGVDGGENLEVKLGRYRKGSVEWKGKYSSWKC